MRRCVLTMRVVAVYPVPMLIMCNRGVRTAVLVLLQSVLLYFHMVARDHG